MENIKKCGYNITLQWDDWKRKTIIIFDGDEYTTPLKIDSIKKLLSKCYCKEHVLETFINII